MMKREANGSFDAGEGSRPKRARRAVNLYEGPSSDAEDEDVVISDGHYSDEEGDATGQSVRMDTQEVKRHGMQIWQSVKDAVSKECVPFPFYIDCQHPLDFRPDDGQMTLSLFAIWIC